jgi:outer membrane protein OmpA-like peptidoglycan-associated protein
METTTEPAPHAPPQVRVVEKHRVRRPLAAAFWVAALVVPLGLTALVGAVSGPTLEADLVAEARTALKDAGVTGVRLEADGRQLVAKVPTGTDADQVRSVVDGVPGVLAVTTESVYASAKEARACTDLQDKLDDATNDQRILFDRGSAQLTGSGLGMVRATGKLLVACGSASVVVGGHADGDTPDGANLSLRRAKALAAALHRAGVADRRMDIRGYGDQFEVSEGQRAQNERGSVVVREG